MNDPQVRAAKRAADGGQPAGGKAGGGCVEEGAPPRLSTGLHRGSFCSRLLKGTVSGKLHMRILFKAPSNVHSTSFCNILHSVSCSEQGLMQHTPKSSAG